MHCGGEKPEKEYDDRKAELPGGDNGEGLNCGRKFRTMNGHPRGDSRDLLGIMDEKDTRSSRNPADDSHALS